MIEETDLTPAAVERFWTDVQDGESKTFTLPAGGANYTESDDRHAVDYGRPETGAAKIVRLTAERDRARDVAALLEGEVERLRSSARRTLTQEGLAAVPAGTVVHAADGSIAARFDATRGVVFGDDRPFPWSVLKAPAVQLWPLPEVAGQESGR